MEIITGLHELYKVEGPRMKAAYEAREKARIEREAYLRANPPQPQDITIHIWKRETPVRPSAPGANSTPGQRMMPGVKSIKSPTPMTTPPALATMSLATSPTGSPPPSWMPGPA